MKMMNFYDRVYASVMKIPKGKVATYGQIAALAGNPRAARAVGNALHINPLPGIIPCHRVVNSSGRLSPAFAFGGEDKQRSMLESEGVIFCDKDRVNLKDCLWNLDIN